jgi:flagellar biosynthetic protein FliR
VNLTILPEFAAAFAIIMARIGTLVMLMPGIGDRVIPVRMRLTFALLLSLLFLPLLRPSLPAFSGGLEPLVRILILEVLIGLMIGTAVRITLSAMQLAGTVIAQRYRAGHTIQARVIRDEDGRIVLSQQSDEETEGQAWRSHQATQVKASSGTLGDLFSKLKR